MNSHRSTPAETGVAGWSRGLLPLAIAGWLGLVVHAACAAANDSDDDASGIEFFEAKVRPLLVQKCYECHSAESGEANGDLRLDSAAATLAGGSMGPALVVGKPEQSLLIKAVSYKDPGLQMPPESKLAEGEIEILRSWIALGAPDPRTDDLPQKSVSPLERDPQTHWAFVAPEPAAAPKSIDESSRDRIDAIAAQRAAAHNISVSDVADDETLIRRLYFDLTGLQPSADSIAAFLKSKRPDAYARLVDQLLASPEFGERFGWHWLDVARYADTVGYALGGKERRINGSHLYRDWVIGAFGSDMPYDEMILHQLAADRTDPENKAGNLHAMGFLTVGRQFLNRLDTLDDQIDVVSRGLLGLTVSCARCHDHKFDPIPTTDYYSLFGIMSSNDRPTDGPSPLMMVDKQQPQDSPVLIRGQQGNRGPISPRQFLTSLRKPNEPRFNDGSGRWELAQRIVAADNPLTSRVLVNRVWTHLIGKSLVDSPSDFGFRTEPPAIPELLDDLAAEFAKNWSIKRLVRRIVMTRIYRQQSVVDAGVVAADPDNRYLARANRKRRDFESLRDCILLAAASLDRQAGGEPVEITSAALAPRRTVYALIDRQNLPSLFRTFDFASPDTHSPRRYFTTVPQQALYLLNNRQLHQLAINAAATARRTAQGNDLATAIFRQVLARDPNPQERDFASQFLQSQATASIVSIDSRRMWSYGFANVSDDWRVHDFTPLPVFKDDRWQAAEEFPAKGPLGYAFVSSDSGHTARNRQGVVRRWTSPAAGEVEVSGVIEHRSEHGDGVRGTVWAGDAQLFTEVAKNARHTYGPLRGRIEAGEILDFVATPQANDSHDSFNWQIQLKFQADDGQVVTADSTKDFSGPLSNAPTQSLDRLAQLAHVLLMSNEFAFVD